MSDQALRALVRANEVRAEHARLLESVRCAGRRDGALAAAALIRAGEVSVTCERLLLAVHGVGAMRAAKMLALSAISPKWRVNGVGKLHRERLARELLTHAGVSG